MVQRWFEDMNGELYPAQFEGEGGGWVYYEDYLALEQEYNKLYEQMLRYKEAADMDKQLTVEEAQDSD